ncbi:winged helix-turn-helix domain-containing protein [Psychrobacter sp. LV10R520-6]|uniref:winged helix-turn-helix domain-containing protein n=1 Tax=Psychrobacter sp. LV10R520-6 TaxID=1415574 RepID=UPI002AA0E2CE|nr:winged helix-turn-helix domain-containing protein [Psychrobacter sp. LV10R520-6]
MTIPTDTLKDHDFGKLSKTESNPRARQRLLMLYQYSIGKATNDIAKDLYIHPETARRTKKRYLQRGLDSIYDRPRRGRHSKLAESDIDAFKAMIVSEQEKRAGGRLTGQDIQQIAKEHYNAHYTVNGIYEMLKRIGMSWISARSQHPKADEEVQETFKKTL